MKKNLYLIMALIASAIAFTSCNSVPDPYDNPNGNKEDVVPGVKEGTGTEADPYNVTAALEKIKALKDGENTGEIFVKGKIVSIDEIDTDKFGNATYYISVDGTDKNQLCIYRSKSLGNQKFTSKDAIKVGDEVVVKGIFVNFKGNKPESEANKSYLYSLNGKKEDNGGTTPTPGGLTFNGATVTAVNSAVTAGTETITVTMTKQSFTDDAAATPITLSDGTTIAFDANGEANAPKYYAKSKGVRLYKNNGITITGKKAIAKLEFTCDVFKGVNYVGNQTATIAFTGNTAVYKNVFNEPKGGGVQLRVQTITITYAQ